jgi:CMP-N,N'-diacetyllegionaminic acid synthase
MKFIVVIPARAGSKSIKGKNIIKIGKYSLIEYTFLQLKKNKDILNFVITDSEKIKKISKKYKVLTNYKRPKSLSKSTTSLIDTLYHFTKWALNEKYKFDYLVVLQPTSPLRNMLDLDKSIGLIKKYGYQSLSSISEVSEHPYEMIKIPDFKKSNWSYVLPKAKNYYRRQDFDFNPYFINGAIFIVNKKLIMKKKLEDKKKHGFYLMPKSRSLDINDKEDLNFAKKYLK